MAKKKTPVVIPETTLDETIIEVPQVEDIAEVATSEPDAAPIDGARYHATFSPTWRPEIDCGDHDSEDAAKEAVERTAKDLEADVILAWRRESPVVWLATGHDGQVDTNMTIAKIVRV